MKHNDTLVIGNNNMYKGELLEDQPHGYGVYIY